MVFNYAVFFVGTCTILEESRLQNHSLGREHCVYICIPMISIMGDALVETACLWFNAVLIREMSRWKAIQQTLIPSSTSLGTSLIFQATHNSSLAYFACALVQAGQLWLVHNHEEGHLKSLDIFSGTEQVHARPTQLVTDT